MTKTEKLKVLQKVAETLKNNGYENVKRSSFINLVKAEGLVEKDTYVVLREWTKSSHRGHYVVGAILREIETKVTGKILTKPVVRKTSGENMSQDLGGQIPYTESDIREELSLMGTRLSSI